MTQTRLWKPYLFVGANLVFAAIDSPSIRRYEENAMIDLKGKVGLITGASRGIGAAAAIKLAEAGKVIV